MRAATLAGMFAHLRCAVLFALATAACSAPPPAPAPASAPPPVTPAPRTPELVLPAGWAGLAPAEFETALVRWTPAGEVRDPAPALAAELERALAGGGTRALRAALVLARARGPVASELLLAHLEHDARRAASRDVSSESAIVAARAFALGATARASTARLVALSSGARAHPDPRVRVECAASAVLAGDRAARALLAAVWSGGTTFGLGENELAPLQERALGALAQRAGTVPLVSPFAAQRARAEELARIQALLAARAAP